MAAFKQCEFFLLRYVPDAVKQEFVNIGVVLLEESGDGFTEVRFTRDWRRVRCLDPEADVGLLQSYEEDMRRLLRSRVAEIVNYKPPMSRREWLLDVMAQSFSGALQLTPAQAILTESPSAELGELAHAYLESERRAAPRERTGRRAIYAAMRDAFEQAGVWQSMRRDIAVAKYMPGDPLRIDCGYRSDSVVHMFQAVTLATDLNAAKVLAFSYPELQTGILSDEGAMTTLTAITEDGLDLHDEGVAFALATLQDGGIQVAPLERMPAIAERARAELKL